VDGPSPQAGLGELSPTEFASAVTAITSAFGDPTRRAIYLFAHESESGITAGDAAKRFDLHANVARHHLDKLCAGGYLEIDLAKPSGGVGRPSKRYRATSPDVRLEVSIRHDDILVSLLGRALALLPADIAEQMAEEVGLEYGRALAAAIDPSETHRSYQGALHAVADALSAHGFAARAETTDGVEDQIVAQNCPFGDAVVEHPVICAVDRGIVRGMLGHLHGPAAADTASSKPQGDDVCVTHVTL
jgi:predicted ArsR family transcriptional regulator